jgi:hypothetical protein
MPYQVAPVYEGLRARAFAFTDTEAPPGSPWGVIMETGYQEGVATLVALSDGLVGLFFSNGQTSVGAGRYPGPAQAARKLGAMAAKMSADLPFVADTKLPEPDEVKLYVLTPTGLRGVAGKQADFGENRLPQSPLFHQAHHVITAIRQIPQTDRS